MTIAIIALLLVIAVSVIVLVLKKPQGVISVDTKPLKELMAGFKHHVEVEAVLALVTEIASRPELKINLAQHSQQIVDAALAHRVNMLGASLQKIGTELARERGSLASTDATMTLTYRDHSTNVAALEAQQTEVQRQLDTLNGVIQGRATVS